MSGELAKNSPIGGTIVTVLTDRSSGNLKGASNQQLKVRTIVQGSGTGTPSPTNLYAEPTRLINLITKKVEPASKVYIAQQTIMMQHQLNHKNSGQHSPKSHGKSSTLTRPSKRPKPLNIVSPKSTMLQEQQKLSTLDQPRSPVHDVNQSQGASTLKPSELSVMTPNVLVKKEDKAIFTAPRRRRSSKIQLQKHQLINMDLVDEQSAEHQLGQSKRKKIVDSKRKLTNKTAINTKAGTTRNNSNLISTNSRKTTELKRYQASPNQTLSNERIAQQTSQTKIERDISFIMGGNLNQGSEAQLVDPQKTFQIQGQALIQSASAFNSSQTEINSPLVDNQLLRGTLGTHRINLSNSTDVDKTDIIVANQISNESLLSKTDILESQTASKRNLPPKFNSSGSPFINIDQMKNKSQVHSKVELTGNAKTKKQQYWMARQQRRRQYRRNDLIETKINATLLNSAHSKDATMTLQCVESLEGDKLNSRSKDSLGDSNESSPARHVNKSADESSGPATPINPLKAVNDIHINMLLPMQLNEVMTTSSFLKIRGKNEVHKNKETKKGPAGIFQQSMQLLGSHSPRTSPPPTTKEVVNQDLRELNSRSDTKQTEVVARSDTKHTTQFHTSTLMLTNKHSNLQSKFKITQDDLLKTQDSPYIRTVTDDDMKHRVPFDIQSQMISEITELLSRDSFSQAVAHQESALTQRKAETAKIDTDSSESEQDVKDNQLQKQLTIVSASFKNTNLVKPQAPVEQKLVTRNLATEKDRQFKAKVQDCVKTLRVKPELKQNMIKLLNKDFKSVHQKRVLEPLNKKKQQNASFQKRVDQEQTMSKTIFDPTQALMMTESRNVFAKGRKSLPQKLTSPKPLHLQKGSPQVRYAPNQIKMNKFGGRFGTDNRRAFSLGVPVPPGPINKKPTALLMGLKVPLHDPQEELMTYPEILSPYSLKKASNRKKQIIKKYLEQPPPYADGQEYQLGQTIPNFADAYEATKTGERGLSAFTKSVQNDLETQTNFNIIDYEDRPAIEEASAEEEQRVCTCLPKTANQLVHISDQQATLRNEQMQHPRTSSMIRREHNESQQWLELANQIVSYGESDLSIQGQNEVPLPSKIVQNNSNLVNMKLDKSKIQEIKQALAEYSNLKNLEQAYLNTEKQSDKEYDANRRRQKFHQTMPISPVSKQMLKKRRETAPDEIQLKADGKIGLQPLPIGLNHLTMVSSEEDMDSPNSPQHNTQNTLQQIHWNNSNQKAKKCPIHDTKRPVYMQTKHQQPTVQRENSLSVAPKDGGISFMVGSRDASRNFNKTVNFADIIAVDSLLEGVQPRDDSVASQGHQQSLQAYDSRNERLLAKKQTDFLDTDKVERNRIKIERIKNVLETQFEKDRTNLERNLKTKVNRGGSFNTRTIRNASLGIGRNESFKRQQGFTQASLMGHKQGLMLERLKAMNTVAESDQQKSQLQVLQQFISAEMRKADGKVIANSSQVTQQETPDVSNHQDMYLPAIGMNSDQLTQSLMAAQTEQSSADAHKQLDSEIQQFQKKHKLLAGVYKQGKNGQLKEEMTAEQVQKINEKMKQINQNKRNRPRMETDSQATSTFTTNENQLASKNCISEQSMPDKSVADGGQKLKEMLKVAEHNDQMPLSIGNVVMNESGSVTMSQHPKKTNIYSKIPSHLVQNGKALRESLDRRNSQQIEVDLHLKGVQANLNMQVPRQDPSRASLQISEGASSVLGSAMTPLEVKETEMHEK